ncbi:MAG TPA: T9SS type A sorting domain-containing protein [Saprospiraceae bacterium]|nr:T9SS type A sorting domain-containing protein [Saprospiraceae bacterium]HMQ84515.1 T9SS type A sorting domain-containing protein [Saprospiraceae bacterium]
MKPQHLLFLLAFCVASFQLSAQEGGETKAFYHGTISSVEYVTSLLSRPHDLIPSDNSFKEAKDKKSIGNELRQSLDTQEEDDYFVRNRHEMEQSRTAQPPSLVFDAFASSSQPTDPSLAVGPNHVFVVFNTGFTIYDKSGNQLLGQTSPNPAIFPSGGCCDLTASYDNAADRWVISFLGNGAQIAVSDGPNPLTSGWYVYTIAQIQDYQKLSVWSDGYYLTENTGGSNKVWAMERAAMLTGSPTAKIVGFNLPGLVTSGFFSPQALNVTDSNLPAPGGATIVYMQDNAWSGVSSDHLKVWTINVNWANTASSTVSAATQIPLTPFISVFDNGSFSNLTQPGGGVAIDALQATIMNQAQFRKFGTHNSAVFNFVVDTDATAAERAGIRWIELRQSGDNQPWTLYQEGTYTAPDGRHAWHASLAMDAQGNIGMGYTSMSGPTTPTTVRVSSYFTGRLSTDPLGTMTVAEQLIANGTSNIPGLRYGDYSKIDVDPSDNSTFWFINEYVKSGRKGVVGAFQIQAGAPDTQAPSNPTNLTATNITPTGATLNWTASTDNVGVTLYNIFIDGNLVGTSATTSFAVTGLTPSTMYLAEVNAQDAAGNTSGNASTNFMTTMGGGGLGEIAAYYFETGFDGWTDGGANCVRRRSTFAAYEGQYGILLRNGTSTSNASSPILNLSGNTQVTVELHSYASGMENGESFFVEFFNGSSYQQIAQYTTGTDFSNGSFFSPAHIVLDAGTYNFNANNRFRIRNGGNQNNDLILFDQVIIRGDNAAPLAPEGPIANATTGQDNAVVTNGSILRSYTKTANENIKIYPNPTQSELNIELTENQYEEITIFTSKGQVVYNADKGADRYTVDVSQLSPGMYFIRFISNGLATTLRFVKE